MLNLTGVVDSHHSPPSMLFFSRLINIEATPMQKLPSVEAIPITEGETQAASPEEVARSLSGGSNMVPTSPTSSMPSSAGALEKDKVL